MIKPLKLKPHSVLKPWGVIHHAVENITGISVGLGELWLASAQKGEGNVANDVLNSDFDGDLAALLSEADNQAKLEKWLGSTPAGLLKNSDYRGKTEAWVVRDAAGMAGFAAGPADEQAKARLKSLLTGPGLTPDVRDWDAHVRELFGLITPVQPGDAFLVPAGTLHTMFALGGDSRLIVDEIQQGYGSGLLPTLSKTLLVENSLLSVQVHPNDETVRQSASGELDIAQDLQANPTVRVYDFGRRPGEYPDLGFKLTDTEAGLRSIPTVTIESEGKAVEFLVACRQFFMNKISLEKSAIMAAAKDLPVFGSYRILHATKGEVEIKTSANTVMLSKGETVFVPGEAEPELELRSRAGAKLYDQGVPDLGLLRSWMIEHGQMADVTESFLKPPRA